MGFDFASPAAIKIDIEIPLIEIPLRAPSLKIFRVQSDTGRLLYYLVPPWDIILPSS